MMVCSDVSMLTTISKTPTAADLAYEPLPVSSLAASKSRLQSRLTTFSAPAARALHRASVVAAEQLLMRRVFALIEMQQGG